MTSARRFRTFSSFGTGLLDCRSSRKREGGADRDTREDEESDPGAEPLLVGRFQSFVTAPVP